LPGHTGRLVTQEHIMIVSWQITHARARAPARSVLTLLTHFLSVPLRELSSVLLGGADRREAPGLTTLTN
jgi:hypothetical protein